MVIKAELPWSSGVLRCTLCWEPFLTPCRGTDLSEDTQNPGGAGGRVQNRAIAPQLRSAVDFSIQALETSNAGALPAFPCSGAD